MPVDAEGDIYQPVLVYVAGMTTNGSPCTPKRASESISGSALMTFGKNERMSKRSLMPTAKLRNVGATCTHLPSLGDEAL
jgi:hypothetical protein